MKFLYAFLIVLALLVAALFLVPSFLDGEQFKPGIEERLAAITGRAVAIEGPVEVSVLPTPTVKASDLRIANATGAAAPDLARIESLELKLALGPLIGGEVAVTSLEIVEPVVELQRLADGSPNWLFESMPEQEPGGPATEEAEATETGLTRIDSATVTNGTVVYRRVDGEDAERIEEINATLTARSLDGPFRGEGQLAVRGRAIAFQFATGTVGEDRTVPASLEASLGGERGSALFEGTLKGLDGVPAFDGSVRAEASDLGALLRALAVDLGSLPEEPLRDEFSAKGALNLSADAMAASDLQLRLGESQATGRTSWEGRDVPRLDAKIVLNRIDLDRFLPDGGAPAPPDAASGSAGEGQSVDSVALVPLQTIADDIRRMIPTAAEADVDFTIGALTWREGVIRQATAHLALAEGVVTIGPASALLPGGAKVDLVGRLTADGDGRWMHSVAEVAAEDLRAILSWLGVDVGAVPADRLRRLSASADLSASGDRLSASGLDIRVDTTRIAGNAAVVTGARPQFAADLAVDAVNVDAYLGAAEASPPRDAEPASFGETTALDDAPQEAAQAAPDPAADDPWAVFDDIDADVVLTVDALTYDGMRLAGLELDAALEDGDLSVRRASVDDAAGARASVTGVAHAVAMKPSFDLVVEGAADSLEGVAALLDIDPDIRTEAFGKATLSGSLVGDEEALELDFEFAAGPSKITLSGTVERPFDEPDTDLDFSLHASSAAALARAAGLTPPPAVTRLGRLAIDGDIDGNLDSVALELSAETAGATVQVGGRVTHPFASPGYSVDVDLEHPYAEALIETLVGASPADVALGALRIRGKVSGDRTVANFGDVTATVGENTLGGGVFLFLEQEPPAFSAELHGGVLDLAWLGGGLAASREADDDVLRLTTDAPASTGVGGAAPASKRWSEETIDLAVLDRLSGTLTLDAEALILGDYRIDRAAVDLAAAEGALTLRSLTGRLFEGALEADGSLNGGPAPAGQAAFALVDADLGAILRAAAGLADVSGTAEADGYFTLRGQNEREMIQSLAGRVALTSSEGAIEGVDVPAIGRQIEALSKVDALDDIPSFVEQTEQSLSSGQTAIRSLDGTVRVQDGQARIDGFEIVADGGVGDISGTANLPAWHLDLTARFWLTGHPDAPPVGVRLEGPIDRPARRYVIEDMQAHLVKLGLLSLAGAPEMPKITLRKGAKAEPGTEMDRLLRNVLGDPDEAEDAGQEKEPAERSQEDAPVDPVPAHEEDGGGSVAPPPGAGPLDVSVDTDAAAPLDPREAEGPSGVDRGRAAEEPLETGRDEEAEAASPAEASQSGEPVPRPPTPPRQKGDEDFRDLLDDLLKSLEE